MKVDIDKLTIDEWAIVFSKIYYQSKNFDKTAEEIILHLQESLTSLRQAIYKYNNWNEAINKWLPKIFAWYCALVKELDINDLCEEAWKKFPGICPFCANEHCECELGKKSQILDRGKLSAAAEKNKDIKPKNVNEWLQLMEKIYSQKSRGLYPSVKTETLSLTSKIEGAILKLYEEIIELSEAYRMRAFYPRNINNEIIDVFITIVGLSNILSIKYSDLYTDDLDLNSVIWNRYPETCDTCRQPICVCTPSALQIRLSNEGIHLYEQKDELTKLGNRAKYMQDRESFVKKIGVQKCIILFDIDDFKSINDQSKAKHKQGDFILQKIGERGSEVLADNGEIYRLGGDEFVILAHAQNKEDLNKLANSAFSKITDKPIASISDDENAFSINISMGVAYFAEDDQAESVHEKADKLAYKSKESGKNKISFDDELSF